MMRIDENNQPTVLRRCGDYTRFKTLELVSSIVNNRNIQGDVAEAGVWTGDFAAAINLVFPDRRLYLYDTFSGFCEEDIEIEINNGFTSEDYFEPGKGYAEVFRSETEEKFIEIVMKKMKYPNNVVIRKGNFPDTADGEDNTTFALVSLDMDVYRPMRDGLDFFWERLSPGGYIFIHDYNYTGHFGVRKAVEEFEAKYGYVPMFPITDSCGSLVLHKPC